MLRVRRGEGCLMIYELVASFKAEKRKVNVGDAWFRVSPLSFSLSWSPGLQTVVCLLLIWPRCREICLLYRFSLLIGSIFFFLCFFVFVFLGFFSAFFYREGHGLAENLLLLIFIFLTNFIDISLCADLMRKNTFFPFLRKSEHR